jgi:hypothetical protein
MVLFFSILRVFFVKCPGQLFSPGLSLFLVSTFVYSCNLIFQLMKYVVALKKH